MTVTELFWSTLCLLILIGLFYAIESWNDSISKIEKTPLKDEYEDF